MEKKLSSTLKLLSFVAVALYLGSCTQNKEIVPSPEFAPYVSGYTGGSISSQSTVRLEFAQDQPIVEPGAELKEKLFDFSPSLKGKTYWVDNRTIEFVPDSGQLKQGTLYNASFKLSKVMKVEKNLDQFAFSFRVIPMNFGLDIGSYTVDASSPETASVDATIRFSDKVDIEQVQKMFVVDMDGDNTFKVEIEPAPGANVYRIIVKDIRRGKEDRTLSLRVKGTPIGLKRVVEETVLIPATEPFMVLNAKLISKPETGVEIVFSDPLSPTQDLRGLIDIPGMNYVYQVEGNKVRLFIEASYDRKEITFNIDKGLRNYKEKSLQASATGSLQLKSLNPQIVISTTGTILPDSKNLILPFKSVNIRAVDIRIIRIFEKNVLTFLQKNTLKSNDEIRRSGRLIYKNTISLDSDPSLNLNKWNDFSIDLADIILREQGAIYRIELSFKKEYSLYGIDRKGSGESAQNQTEHHLTPLVDNNLTEEDEAFWDTPSVHYWDEYVTDWDDDFNWRDENDPSKPSYYKLIQNIKTSCNVVASNLGVIAKMNNENKLWVTVNNILNTDPIKDAEVKVYNFQLQTIGSAKTNTDGWAEIDPKGKPFILVAEAGQQKAYLRLADGEEKSLSRFDVGGKEIRKGIKGFVFGERGVWRPGDTLHIGFILEDKQHKIPNSHPVWIQLYNPKGQFYSEQVSTKGLNGFYTFHIPTDPDDMTGLWNVYVQIGGAWFHHPLRMETVKPNRLKINLDIPGTKLDATRGAIQGTLSSNWLTGATARELDASVEMSLSKVNTQFKGYEKYVFNDPATSFYTVKFEVFDGKLNSEGNANFTLKLPEAQNAPGMLQATFVSRVFEPGGDASSFVKTIPFSPYTAYVGINLHENDKSNYYETDDDHVFDVITLNGDGKPIDRQNLDYRVYKLNWSWWWESNQESLDSYVNNTYHKPVISDQLSTKGGKAGVKFRIDYPEWGRYLVYIKDKESGHASGKIIYVDWPSWRGRSTKTDPNGITMLSFSMDKEAYEIGEEATVILPAAAKGAKVLVAFENGSSVISRHWVTVADTGDTKYTFKITDDMSPNFYLHASLLQPHDQTANDSPIRMYGVIPVMVNNKNSKLQPEINMPETLRPEKEFVVKVKEKTGRPMTYTLAIVDEGLLDLTAFKTPDPWNEFYTREALGIRTWDMYDHVIGAFGGKFSPLFSTGGDETLKPINEKANRFKPVVKFIGPFAIKKGETGTHKIQLPPYVGSVRTMVVAEQDGAYGRAEKTTPVKNPLMILSTLPRVMSVGEEILLPVNVFAMENTIKDVTVKVETSGLSKVTDAQNKSVKFSQTGDQMVYFSLKVGPRLGVEKIKLMASANGESVSEEIEIQVRNPNPAIIEETAQLIAASQEKTLNYSLKEKSDENWVKMEISRIPSVDLNRRFDYLNDYTHCCSEQVTSKAFPLLYIENFKELTEKEKESIGKNVREAIRQLYARQLQNGGFAYWAGQTGYYPWVNSYVGHFLYEARKKGYEVNESVLSRWKESQRSAALAWQYESDGRHTRYMYYQEDLQQAYRLYTLVVAGAPERGAMNRLKEMEGLSLQARWRLAAAYALDGKKDAANNLAFNVETHINPYSSSNATYGSSDRDEAMILETLVLLDNMPKAFEQAKRISQNLSSRNYFDTHSTAYALMAMGAFAGKVGKGMIEIEWSVNGKAQKKIQTAKPVQQLDVPTDVLSGTVKIKNIGTGELFVSMTSKYKPLNDTLPESANNLKVEVFYTDLNGKPISVTSLKQGTDFAAIVQVSNISGMNDYTDLALSQIFPSGWEIFNERMMSGENTDSPKQNYTFKDIRDDRIFTYFDLSRSKVKTFHVRLRAAYVGKFILPSVQCEAMYDTQTQGRTKANRVEVIK